MTLELTVLIPALNEADSLPTVLSHVTAVMKGLTDSFEVLVVDGGSKDETVARASAAGARVLVQRGRGFGSAVREGLLAAQGRYIISMDGDGSHPASIFRTLWERRREAQLIVASRYMPGGSAVMPSLKHALSVLLNLVSLVVLSLPVRDSSSGLRIYEGSAVRALPLSAEDFTIQQETMVRILAAGGRVMEVPFHYAPRIGGVSKADIPFLAKRYLLMLWRLSRVRRQAGQGPAS